MQEKHLDQIIITSDKSVKNVLELIEKSNHKIAIVVDNVTKKVVGTVTDGDVRRGIIAGKGSDSKVSEIMNPFPFLKKIYDKDLKKEEERFKYIPVVDENNNLINISAKTESNIINKIEMTVVIMAGGRGERLRPITDTIPKPMIPINGKPLLETLLYRLKKNGITDFVFTLNYLSNQIKDYFGNGKNFGVNITYAEEKYPLGTAGSLSLIRKKITNNFIVLNADLVVSVDFEKLVQFHECSDSFATICVREYSYHVPFGVVDEMNGQVIKITEKPTYTKFINAGIYVFSSDVLKLVEKDKYLDMPNLIQKIINEGKKITTYHLTEDWVDVGRFEDLTRMMAI